MNSNRTPFCRSSFLPGARHTVTHRIRGWFASPQTWLAACPRGHRLLVGCRRCRRTAPRNCPRSLSLCKPFVQSTTRDEETDACPMIRIFSRRARARDDRESIQQERREVRVRTAREQEAAARRNDSREREQPREESRRGQELHCETAGACTTPFGIASAGGDLG